MVLYPNRAHSSLNAQRLDYSYVTVDGDKFRIIKLKIFTRSENPDSGKIGLFARRAGSNRGLYREIVAPGAIHRAGRQYCGAGALLLAYFES